jgi:hypothetical protein
MVSRQHLFGLFILLWLEGCSGVSTVRDVQTHPRRNWFNSTVYLRGQVSDRAPMLDAQVYQLEDGTGKVWVLTDKVTPKKGDSVYIKGKVIYEKILMEGEDFSEAYIEEQEQLDPKAK